MVLSLENCYLIIKRMEMVNSEFKTVVIFFCEKMAIGGTETLIMRLLMVFCEEF
jgi:hypothetical protein